MPRTESRSSIPRLRRASRLAQRSVVALSILAATLALPGCDNPACVFGPTNCRDVVVGGGPGGIGTASAVFPTDASWIAPSAPSVVRIAPAIFNAHSESPLIVEFDQSLDPASLSGAFEVLDTITFLPVPLADPPALIGDGRVVVIVPMAPLTWIPGQTYGLRFTSDQHISDVTGQAFDFGANQDLLEFGIAFTPPTEPRVLYTYPADGATLVSDLTELVVAFDRTMNASTFSNESFAVTVNGAAPMPNPNPSSLLLTGGQIPIPVLQVWRWSSVDSNSIRQSLGGAADVQLRLSPTGHTLEGRTGGTLATTDISFDTATFRAPAGIRKAPTAPPVDAVGGPNLAAGDVLEVTLADAALSGDTLDVFVIGGSPANAMLLKAEQRSVTLDAGAMVVTLTGAQLNLREANSAARFRDGEIEFMARLRRGTASTVARRTDGNPAVPGFQRLVLDLTPPQLLGLGTSGSNLATYTSKLGGIVIVGRGDEEIRFARVSTSVGDNHGGPDDRPATALSASRGLFVAAPVDGVLDEVFDPAAPAITYTVEAFDRALNPAPTLAVGTFTQVGAVGPGAALPGPNVNVRVFDADTGEPLSGVRVMSHEEVAGVVTSLTADTTTLTGAATVTSAVAGATLVTAQLAGYDSFTLHGVPTARLDIPLFRAGTTLATIQGDVISPLTSDFSNRTKAITDNRFPSVVSPLGPVMACGLNTLGQRACAYGPLPIRARRIGLTSFFATDTTVVAPFPAATFLRGLAFRFSEQTLAYAQNETDVDLIVDPTEQVTANPTHSLDYAQVAMAGHFGTLASAPILTVEGFGYGLEGAPTVGMGVSFVLTATEWLVLGATANDALPGGDLADRRAIESGPNGDLLYLRAELIDTTGNRVGARPRFSNSGGDLTPIDLPRFLVPGPNGMTGGDDYNLQLADVVADGLGMAGLYRVTLTDLSGRRWHLWTFDPTGGTTVSLSLPPVAALGGTPLMDGAQSARVSVWAWPGLDPTRFLWVDVERRHEVFAHTASVMFTQD